MKRNFIILLLSVLALQNPIKAYGQISEDINNFEKIKIYKPEKKRDYSYAKEQFKTFQVLFSGMFLFYKNFISSQDNSSCPFRISCSEYFIKSVQKKGVILGFLNGIDRYKRCNGFSNNRYERDYETGKLIDPVD
ncbi:MAG: membrane protein insertion efficiency factor YidD [Bacteroidales bacterium]|nr:membrane protein insertion efficiency factor YidD [Bacteroidales bacterium]